MEFFATSHGIPVHISDSEKGEKVIFFLHGYLETLYIWEEFRALLPDYFRTVAIDLPGHGLSSSHPSCNDMRFCADVVTGVLDILHISDCILCGHSMGGYVGQACLRQYPERYSSLIHFNSTPFADSPEKAPERLKEIGFIESGKLMQLASIAIPNMYASKNLRSMDKKIQETIEICEAHDPFGISAMVRGLMKREDSVDYLISCGKPLFFVFGDSDRLIPVDMAESILHSISSSRGVIVPNTGHNSFIEDSQTVLKAVLDFLG